MSTITRPAVASLFALQLAIAPSVASAVDVLARCSATYSESQVEKKAAHLLKAREKLVVCAQPTCPSFITADCTQWLAEVDARMPQVAFVARDRSGRDKVDVTVAMDGQEILHELSGKAVAVDPGAHTFTFTTSGAPSVSEQTIIAEGEKSRVITVTIGGEAPASAGKSAVVAPRTRRASAVPAIVVGAAGIVVLGASAFFGFSAKSDVDHMKSTCAPTCPSGDIHSADAKILVSDVTLAVGVVAIGIAAWLFFSRGEVEDTSARVPGLVRF